MQRYLFIVFLVLSMVTPLMAVPYERTEEYRQKQAILNERAARFKAETGFEGSIDYNYRDMKFSRLTGEFTGIQISAPQDTVSTENAIDQVLLRISPYISAREDQLNFTSSESNRYIVSKKWEQKVNGFSVYPRKFIIVAYNLPTKEFIISDSTVDLPSCPVQMNVSKTEAKQLMLDAYKQSVYCKDETNRYHRDPSIGYINVPISESYSQYRLCWSMMFDNISISVDAETQEIRFSEIGRLFYKYSVSGMTYEPTISGTVFSPTSPPESPLRTIAVNNGSQTGYTDRNGSIELNQTPQENYHVNLSSDRWKIRSKYSEFTALVAINCTEVDSLSYLTNFLDAIDIQDGGNQDSHTSMYAANIYYYLQKQDDVFSAISPSFSSEVYPTIYNDCTDLHQFNLGGAFQYDPVNDDMKILYYNGYNPYLILHELSHFFTYNRMNSTAFGGLLSDTDKGMDEAFAEYWLGRGLDSNSSIRNYDGSTIAIDLLDVYDIQSSTDYNRPGLPLNEEFYSWYYCGRPIAAALENIRIGMWFDDFDVKLVSVLSLITDHNPDVAKPRYFYNVLMATSSPSEQVIIDKAYSDRGLFFSPKVVSAGEPNPTDGKDKNKFRVGDPIYVKVTNCPQNTPIKVYIVEDQEYTDGMNISTLNPLCQVNGVSNSDGVWVSNTPIMNAVTPGDYDILVDIGDNGVLHFEYRGANVRDGFDGLDGRGFTIFDDGIDVVLALDLSQSMVEECSKLQQLTKRFISALQPGDKINIFGFNEGNPPNWSGGYNNLSPTPASLLFNITQTNQSSLINGVGLPSADGNTDLLVPFTNGYNRFGTGSERKKGFILLSDGEHHPTIDPLNPNNPTVSNPHTMSHVSNSISMNYNPRDIRCFTMRFGDIPSGILNMSNIASRGHGIAYKVPQLSSMSLILSRLINSIRGNPPSYDDNHSIPPNSNQTLQIVVDDMAECLRTTLLWNSSVSPTAGGFTLTSPSGTVYTQPDCLGNSTFKYAIDTPESGVWTANITNTFATSQTYSLVSEIDSDLKVCVGDIPTTYPVDCPMPLSVSVSDYNTPIVNASVNALLTRGDWQYSIALYDDGSHNDGTAGDGMYGNYLYAYSDIVTAFPYFQQSGYFDLSIVVDIPSINGKRVVRQDIYFNPASTYSYPQVIRNLHKGWNWVGYPRLQRDEVGASIPYANASLSPFLTDVVSSDGIAEYRNDRWSYYGLNSLKSEYGYKLRINDTDSVRLFELGSIADTLDVHNLKANQWNWVTYPCYENAYPWEALSGVIDQIDYIMAESWSMKKDGNVWVYDGYSRPHLQYGDSIMIRAVADCSFVWNNPLTTPIIVDPKKPSYFTFEDKACYETIMIESIEGNPEYSEIGVYQDDLCIGARVNEAYPIQILAYSTPQEDGGGQLSFMLYSESKGAVPVSPASIHFGDDYVEEPIIEPIQYGFRRLTLQANDQQLPSVLALHTNYPNPFNPSTTISFSLPKTAPVKLVIYNIRGQKVKSLLNESLEAGNHRVVWDGRDDTNRSVGSGVYYTRLEQNGTVKVSKMMLLK